MYTPAWHVRLHIIYKQQPHNVSWSPMKSLIQRGLTTTRQDCPTMSQVIEALREMKV